MRTLVFLLALLPSAPVFGWGQTGHRVAGEIATAYLSPETESAVRAILGTEGLARASTWADFMRASPAEFWQEKAGPWHYVTIPAGRTYDEVGAPPQGDAFTALTGFRETLVDPDASPEDRARALRFAVHIIADLHQPLHVGNGTDRGGNDFDVEYFGQTTNLHRLWDSQMIDRMQLSYTELAAWLLDDIDDAAFRAWNEPDPQVWMRESAELRDRIYPKRRALGWDYGFQWCEDLYRRLSQAGVRTAAWLNRVFAPPPE